MVDMHVIHVHVRSSKTTLLSDAFRRKDKIFRKSSKGTRPSASNLPIPDCFCKSPTFQAAMLFSIRPSNPRNLTVSGNETLLDLTSAAGACGSSPALDRCILTNKQWYVLDKEDRCGLVERWHVAPATSTTLARMCPFSSSQECSRRC